MPDKYNHVQKCAQVVARLCEYVQGNIGHKFLFDNWFTTIGLLIYIKENRILAVGTTWANRLPGCPLEQNKAIDKEGRGSTDYRVDLKTGLFIIRWMDSSTGQFASNFVGIEPMGTLNRWVSHGREKTDIVCPKVVTMYNKSMGGVDLADMLIALYRRQRKTTHWYWYIKLFGIWLILPK